MVNSFVLVVLLNWSNAVVTAPESYKSLELCEQAGKQATAVNGKVRGFWCLQVPVPEKR